MRVHKLVPNSVWSKRYDLITTDLDEPLTYSSLVLSIGSDLRVERVVPTCRDFDIVTTLNDQLRYKFSSRFRTLTENSPASDGHTAV